MKWIKRHKWWTGLTILVLSVSVWWWAGTQINYWNIVNLTPPTGMSYKNRVVAFGDSLTVGFGASNPEQSYVGCLSKRIGQPIVNKGVNGNTSANGVQRVETDVVPESPRVLLLLFGGNDLLTRVPMDVTIANLERIIRVAQGNGAMVVLVGIQPPLIGGKMGAAMRTLAKQTGCVYVPDIIGGIFGRKNLMSDQIHPNDTGYAMMADRVWGAAGSYIEKALRSSGS